MYRGAVITRHKYQRSLFPFLIVRNEYERHWVDPIYWWKHGQLKYVYSIHFHGPMDDQRQMEHFLEWVKIADLSDYGIKIDRYGIMNYVQEEPNFYHCWCELFTNYLQEIGGTFYSSDSNRVHYWK